MYDVNFSLGEISALSSAVSNAEHEINSKHSDGASAASTTISVLQSAISTARDSLSKMSSDRSKIAFVQAKNSKKIESLNRELGSLRNSNTEGCNDSQIKQLESQVKHVQNANGSLERINSQLSSLMSTTESKKMQMENLLSSIKSALDKFESFFKSDYQKFTIIRQKCDKAKQYGMQAKQELSFGQDNSSGQLIITNIDSLIRVSRQTESTKKSICENSKTLLKTSYTYGEIMQDDIMRTSTGISNELCKQSDSYSRELDTMSKNLERAYHSLKNYKSCGM